jgi:CubicO group peptidase (beta-lactamase class C family)
VRTGSSQRRLTLALLGVISLLSYPAPAAAQWWPHAARATSDSFPDLATRLARVEAILRTFEGSGKPGLAIAILEDGELVYARGYGTAQLEYGIPITPRTVFHVASVSKQFTAFAIAMLAEQGKLALSDDVRRYLPDLPDFGARITIRDLVHHMSGLRDQWTLLTMAGWRLDDVITQADILRLVRRQRELNFPPGSEHVYSNTGYTLLAEIVRVVTGTPFPDWMRKQVFVPLGMTDTHFHDDHRTVVKNRAYSYSRTPSGAYRRAVLNYANVGATSLFTTAEDLTRWARNFFHPSVGGEAVIQQMYERGVLTRGEELDYAFGLELAERGGRRYAEHSGGDAGFRSHILMAPEERFAVVVLANNARTSPSSLARRVAQVFLPDATAAEVTGSGAGAGSAGEGPFEPLAKVPGEDLNRVSGLYWNPTGDYIRRIYERRGRLYYNRGASNESELAPLGEDRFRMLGVDVPLQVWFEPSGSEPERMLVRIADGEPLVSKRVEPPPEALDLVPYAGAYVSEELAATYWLLVEGSGLMLRHWRHGDVALRPVAVDRFESSAWWLGSVRFERDERDRITGFRSSSGRVRNLLFERRGDVPPSERPAERKGDVDVAIVCVPGREAGEPRRVIPSMELEETSNSEFVREARVRAHRSAHRAGAASDLLDAGCDVHAHVPPAERGSPAGL